ncbi:unnamed protein product [Brassicogethes aeneus]|uniref:Uncharacterized protein n=1 Tax=Brassicogethes aeneus TaxID=1431903 RepID=A0A9P0B4A1_BRAAE|nr:unnamed protein product [Brassicogethes aeneus]
MACTKCTTHLNTLIVLLILPEIYSVTIKDVFTSTESLVRIPRDNKYYLGRYGSGLKTDSPSERSLTLKPEDTPEKDSLQNTAVGKRCARCDSGYLDRDRDRYDYRNRYDDRDIRDRRRGGYEDRYQDRYDSRYEDRGSYDRYDRDRYNDRYQDRYQDRDRYDDRRYEDYDRYDRGYDRDRSRYDPRDRYSDRGVGYDNRGYDYRRGDYDRGDNYRPYDETYRGTSGFDVNSGRGYYYASTRPDYGSSYGGSGGSGGYASSWNYGGGKNDYRDRYSSGGDGGYYRPRDPYDGVGGGYRGTSYLYGRPSSTTTDRPTSSNNSSGGSVTQTAPLQQETASG